MKKLGDVLLVTVLLALIHTGLGFLVDEGARQQDEPTHCNETVAEVMFVLDSSGSVGDKNFILMKDFVKTFIKQLDIGPNLARVGVISYNRYPSLRIHITDYVSKQTLLAAIDREIPYSRGVTETHLALDMLRQEGFVNSRPNVPKVAVVITDGKSYQPNMTLTSAAAAQALGITLFAIGVGNESNAAELRGIASLPSAGHVFQVSDFAALSRINNDLANEACKVNVTSTNTVGTTQSPVIASVKPPAVNTSVRQECNQTIANVVFILDSSGSLGQTNFDLVKQFVINVIRVLDIGENETKIGVITFNNYPAMRLKLDTYHDKFAIINAVNNIPYYPGNTQTNLALDLLNAEGFQGQRPDTPNIAIIITDGRSTEPARTKLSAEEAKSQGTTIFAIGVGDSINREELNLLSSDPDRNFVFFVKNFTSLASIEQTVARSACEAPELLNATVPPTSTQPTTPFVTTEEMTSPITTQAENPTTQDLTTESYTLEPVTTASSCLAKLADVVFVLDSSGSVGDDNFNKVKSFVKLTVDFFDVGISYTRVGLITFNEQANLQFGLRTYNSSTDVKTAIDNIRYSQGGTNTASALELLRNQGFSKGRPTIPHIAIVVTDGLSRDPLATKQQALLAKQKGITLIAIGVGSGVDRSELANIASQSSPESSYVYQVGDFEALTSLESVIAYTACQVGILTGPPPSVTSNMMNTTTALLLGCYDKISDCSKYGFDACSDYEPWARDHCELYCGFCPGPKTTPPSCENAIPNCVEYGTYICTDVSLASWTEQNCRAYCGLCGNNTLPTEPATKPPVKTTTDGRCRNLLGNCEEYGGKSMCAEESYKSWAMHNCAEYCGFCTAYTMVTGSVTTNNDTCPDWKLPVECLMVNVGDGCCPLPLCPPNFILTAEKKQP